MMRVHFAIPGDPETRTGGYIYDRRVMELLPAFGIDVVHLQLPGGFPFPSETDLAQTRRLLADVPAQDVVLADGLAWGACPPELARAVAAKIVALCHHPLAFEAGLSPEQSAFFLRNEREALAGAAHVVVTSAETARTLVRDFAVPAEKIAVAEPGAERRARAKGSDGTPHILAVGSLVPRKGYDVLIDALTRLARADWRCTIAGSLARAPDFVAQVQDRIRTGSLAQRVVLAGEVEDARLDELYASADIFVSSSHYEGYGMALDEALAHGLPIVAATGGAAASTAPDSAALKAPPGDAAALAQAIGALLRDAALRKKLADNAWVAARALRRWPDTAEKIASVIRAVAARAPEAGT